MTAEKYLLVNVLFLIYPIAYYADMEKNDIA